VCLFIMHAKLQSENLNARFGSIEKKTMLVAI
jgi:hypothetical protein